MGGVRIISSARKHGADVDDILHALRDPLRTIPLEDLAMAIGTARDDRDTAEIRAAVQMREHAQKLIDEAVIVARSQSKLTWIEIAAALGVSPPAARQKYLDRV